MKYQTGSLRQVKRSDGWTWLFRFRTSKDGKRVENTKRIGLVKELRTETDAWKKIDEMGLRAEVNKDADVDRLTFGVLALRYLDAEFRNEGIVHVVKKSLIPKWGNVPAEDIKRKEIHDWLNGFRGQGYAGPTIGKAKQVMHGIYEYGLFEEVCRVNPCASWRLKNIKSTYRAITVTPAETLVMLQSFTNMMYFTLVFTVAATALRASEVVALRWADIQWEETRIRISKSWRRGKERKPKTAASDATVPLGPILAQFLRSWKEQSLYAADTDFVFPSLKKKGKVPVCASIFVHDHLRPAAIAAGVQIPDGYRFGLHNLRHSLATWLVNKGNVNPKTVQETLRHSRIQTTLDLYVQGNNDNKLSAQEEFCELIKDCGRFPKVCGSIVDQNGKLESVTA